MDIDLAHTPSPVASTPRPSFAAVRPAARRLRLAMAAAIVSLLCGDAAAQDLISDAAPITPPGAGAASNADGPIAIGDAVPADTAIDARLRSIFEAVETLGEVVPSTQAGVVTLQGAVPDAVAADEAVQFARRTDGVITVIDRLERRASVVETLEPGVERIGRRVRDAIQALPAFGIAVALFVAIVVAGIVLARWRAPLSRFTPNTFIAEVAGQAIRIAAVILGVVVALDFVGASALLGALLGAAGILGLAIGFAVRDTIENYVASIFLSLRQPFAPHDLVRIADVEGFVLRLTARATVLLTVEGNHVRIPNATVFKSIIVNYTRSPERRFDFALGVNADASLKEALALGTATLAGLPFTLDEPEVGSWIEEVGDSTVVIRFVGWIDQSHTDFFQARSEAIRLVKRALEEAGFELPEPIYRVRMDDTAPPAEATASPLSLDGELDSVGNTSKLGTIEQRVSAERDHRGRDLLDAAAAKE